MNAALIVQLLITFGPQAIDLIEKLVALWSKPTLTVEEVLSITALARKSYDQGLAAAKAALQVAPAAPAA